MEDRAPPPRGIRRIRLGVASLSRWVTICRTCSSGCPAHHYRLLDLGRRVFCSPAAGALTAATMALPAPDPSKAESALRAHEDPPDAGEVIRLELVMIRLPRHGHLFEA